MSRFASPLWRVAGSFVSWLLFSVSFTLLYMGSATVMGLGGFCASGGPYVIQTQCPEAVVAYVPLSIFGGLAAAAIGAIFAQGFGTPLISWAWPILFVGLGAAFLISSTTPGAITFLIIGVLFVAMGLVPLVLEFRASAQRLFLGSTNSADARFVEGGRARTSLTQFTHWGSRESGEPIPPSAGDWALSLGILVAAVGLGLYLASLLWRAAGG
ncbi:MAG: hypothetical protein ABI566_00735 [Pseudolysinimonas sp.]